MDASGVSVGVRLWTEGSAESPEFSGVGVRSCTSGTAEFSGVGVAVTEASGAAIGSETVKPCSGVPVEASSGSSLCSETEITSDEPLCVLPAPYAGTAADRKTAAATDSKPPANILFSFLFFIRYSLFFSFLPYSFFTVNVKNCRRKYPVGRIFIQLSPLFSTVSHCTKVSIDRFPKVCKDNERKNHILPPKGRIFTDNKTPPESGRYFAGNPGEIVDQDKSNQLRTDRRSFRSRLRRYAPLPELSAGQASS